MTDEELNALLDAHDVLVKSCVDLTIPFEEFLALYDDFPHAYALGGHGATPDQLAMLGRSRKRIAFHFRVAGVLSGMASEADLPNRLYEEARRFAPAVGLMRLRTLIVRYPELKAEPEGA
jgi:hypothetical protein